VVIQKKKENQKNEITECWTLPGVVAEVEQDKDMLILIAKKETQEIELLLSEDFSIQY
jgi:hypothetical protein